MKFITWNVNGLRACMKKGFKDFFDLSDADIFAIQETKMQEEQKEFDFPNYYEYWNSAEKKGYSGTLIYTKKKPINVFYGFNGKYNDEGRAITLEYDNFYFVTIYSPNSQPELARIDYRMAFEDDLKSYLATLNKTKPVILCGDLNVAHNPIDLTNPKANEKNPGYSIEERTKFTALLADGHTDTFRYLHPEKVQYTWWSYRFFAREKGIGWRIDYFVTSDKLKDLIDNVIIHDQVLGSDHCPVEININL
ncbi:MAG TPA: exodeoxyribonuclease III [Bacilli bacterium]|nr:exodeoxyribonuclease III [Bacilli bacterium]